jgi:hypothetical protein
VFLRSNGLHKLAAAVEQGDLAAMEPALTVALSCDALTRHIVLAAHELDDARQLEGYTVSDVQVRGAAVCWWQGSGASAPSRGPLCVHCTTAAAQAAALCVLHTPPPTASPPARHTTA